MPTRAHAARPAGASGVTFHDATIDMAHGAGGRASRRLLDGLVVPILGGPLLADRGDAAVVQAGGTPVAMTADSFVVRPLRFPGGSIGDLAVNGTANDLAVSGAVPHALLVTLILEAGLARDVLEAELQAMADAAARAAVRIVGGDTKVVEHGKADGMYVTTAGIGVPDPRARLGVARVRVGDRILVSGPLGDHGCTILLARGDVDLDAVLRSDTRPIWPLVDALLGAVGSGVKWMRDPTRGGAATTLNELAGECGLGVWLQDADIPIREEVRGICELLGLDPLHIANEGQFVAVVSPESVDAALAALRACPGGESAACIGEMRDGPAGAVVAGSPYGGQRMIDMLVGDPLPRIC